MPFNRTKNRVLDLHLHSLIAQGNHIAFLMLKRRYEKYSRILCKEVLAKYANSGVSLMDLFSVCMACFKEVVIKYDEQRMPLYDYWKEVTSQRVIDYLLRNSYTAKAKTFYGILNLDNEDDEKKINLELIRENDEDYIKAKAHKEALRIISENRNAFTNKEFFLLHYFFEGYTIQELAHGEVMSRSSLYSTFNSAYEKLTFIAQEERKVR